MNKRSTQMTEDTFEAIRANQQVDKYEALNTYKIKLATTQAVNYTKAIASTVADTGKSLLPGEQNSFLPYWYLPAIEGNHIENCLMRIKSVSMSIATYTFYAIGIETIEHPDPDPDELIPYVDYELNKASRNILYVMCDSLIQKTFSSVEGGGQVIRKPILGSYNFSHLVKDQENKNEKEELKARTSKTDNTSMMDDGWILAKNPFGSKISLHLEHNDLNIPFIKSSTDGIPGDTVNHTDVPAEQVPNKILNIPIIYELEIKLLPDNESNDRFSY